MMLGISLPDLCPKGVNDTLPIIKGGIFSCPKGADDNLPIIKGGILSCPKGVDDN